ncbi:hypothetical protein HDU93_006743, partial [Gonapodya sp. JEL0774]
MANLSGLFIVDLGFESLRDYDVLLDDPQYYSKCKVVKGVDSSFDPTDIPLLDHYDLICVANSDSPIAKILRARYGSQYIVETLTEPMYRANAPRRLTLAKRQLLIQRAWEYVVCASGCGVGNVDLAQADVSKLLATLTLTE